MSIKKLQSDFTTPEQSKRLLELGVPRWSANGLQTYRGIKVLEEPQYDNPSPCWSVGRLIEIYDICASEYLNGINIPRNHIILDKVLIEFFGALQHGDMDFLKLEE